MLPSYLLVMALATLLFPQDPAGPTPAEQEWGDLQETVALKILRHKQSQQDGQPGESFQPDIAAIGGFVRKYKESEPDFAWAARIFLATQVLSDALGRQREAAQLLREVVINAELPILAGTAAIGAAQILQQLDDEPGIRQIRELHHQRTDKEQQFEQALDDFILRLQLQPGRTFPGLQVTTLDGAPFSTTSARGKLLLVLFFNLDHGPSVEALRRAIEAHQKWSQRGFELLGVSLDEDCDALKAWLAKGSAGFPVSCDGKAWNSTAARQLGVTRIPNSVLVDPEGTIAAVDAHGPELEELIQLHLIKDEQE